VSFTDRYHTVDSWPVLSYLVVSEDHLGTLNATTTPRSIAKLTRTATARTLTLNSRAARTPNFDFHPQVSALGKSNTRLQPTTGKATTTVGSTASNSKLLQPAKLVKPPRRSATQQANRTPNKANRMHLQPATGKATAMVGSAASNRTPCKQEAPNASKTSRSSKRTAASFGTWKHHVEMVLQVRQVSSKARTNAKSNGAAV